MEHRILELNQNSSRYLQVHKNTIRYTGKGARSNDVGVSLSLIIRISGRIICNYKI